MGFENGRHPSGWQGPVPGSLSDRLKRNRRRGPRGGSPVVVLGMHRAGTSLVARVLHSLGISMGPEMLEGDWSNPDGFYEDLDFLQINKELLKAAGGGWCSGPITPATVEETGEAFEEQARELIRSRQEDAGPQLWGWKDPRTILTSWFWHPICPPTVSYVIVRRHPEDVVKSLVKVHNLSATFWESVVKIYDQHLSAFIQVHRPRHVSLWYEELIDKDRYTNPLHRLARFYGISEHKFDELDFIKFREVSFVES